MFISVWYLEVLLFQPHVLSRGLDGLSDREEDRGRQEERRFSDALGRVDGLRVAGAVQEGDVELARDVAEGRDLVGARASGEKDAVRRVDQLFHHEEAVALHEAPFDLYIE